jgi:hypothetical protein
MKKLDISEGIERVEALFAELKAIEHWDKDYWRCRHNELGATVALVSRCHRKVEIFSELVAIVSALDPEKSDLRQRRPLTKKNSPRSFLRMD